MKIDLITGFLGAGKTTFIANYMQHIAKQGEKVLIIENEFGIAGVDKALLKSDGHQVVEISGGCVCCTQGPKLIGYILEAYEQGYDRIVFEPSGIYNVDTLFQLLQEPSLAGKCVLNAIITIVKPDELSYSQGAYQNIFMSQFLSAGAIVFSNVQSYTTDQINEAVLAVCDFCKKYSTSFDIEQLMLYTKDWDSFTDADYQALACAGRSYFAHKQVIEVHAGLVEHIFVAAKIKSEQQIKPLLQQLFQMEGAQVVRIKGYVKVNGQDIYMVNCTEHCFAIEPCQQKHAILNVIGANMKESTIKEIVKAFA